MLHLPCVSRASSWSIRGCWRFLRGVLVVFDMVDAPRIHQGSYISIFKSLPSWKVLHLLCVSRASSWSLRGLWWFLRGVLIVFNIMDFPCLHQGRSISICISLPFWKVVLLKEEGMRNLWYTEWRTDRQTDGQTDRSSYRGGAHLKSRKPSQPNPVTLSWKYVYSL